MSRTHALGFVTAVALALSLASQSWAQDGVEPKRADYSLCRGEAKVVWGGREVTGRILSIDSKGISLLQPGMKRANQPKGSEIQEIRVNGDRLVYNRQLSGGAGFQSMRLTEAQRIGPVKVVNATDQDIEFQIRSLNNLIGEGQTIHIKNRKAWKWPIRAGEELVLRSNADGEEYLTPRGQPLQTAWIDAVVKTSDGPVEKRWEKNPGEPFTVVIETKHLHRPLLLVNIGPWQLDKQHTQTTRHRKGEQTDRIDRQRNEQSDRLIQGRQGYDVGPGIGYGYVPNRQVDIRDQRAKQSQDRIQGDRKVQERSDESTREGGAITNAIASLENMEDKTVVVTANLYVVVESLKDPKAAPVIKSSKATVTLPPKSRAEIAVPFGLGEFGDVDYSIYLDEDSTDITTVAKE